MPSTSETGHAKNVANYQKLITYCTGLGADYVPANVALEVRNMQTQYDLARLALNQALAKQTIFDNETDVRKDAFKMIKKLSTRIVKAFSSSGVAESVVEGARTINRRIQGQRANTDQTPSPTPSPSEDTGSNRHSVSQLSYDYQLEHLNAMIELAGSHVEYNPNETDLQVRNLQTLYSTLTTYNTNVINANNAWGNARISRDNKLYAEKTGLVPVALKAKEYIGSVFGTTSPQFKQVNKITFKNL